MRPLLALIVLLVVGIWSPPAVQMLLGTACADLHTEHHVPPDWGDAELEDAPELEDSDDDDDASTHALEAVRTSRDVRAHLAESAAVPGEEHRDGVHRPPRNGRA